MNERQLPKRGAIAIVQRDRLLLVVQRAARIVRGGSWCFPGGHVEPGETSARAIKRELLEELAIQIHPTRKIGYVRVGERAYVLAVWRADWIAGSIVPAESEIASYRWLSRREIREMQGGLPTNSIALDLLARDDECFE